MSKAGALALCIACAVPSVAIAGPRLSRDARVVILGAGPAGISAARELRRRGYKNVRLIEKEADVGGKTSTHLIDGRPHDLGATMGVPFDYHRIDALARAANNPREYFPPIKFYSPAAGGEVGNKLSLREHIKTYAEIARFAFLRTFVWKGLDGSGMEKAPALLSQSWEEVASQLDLNRMKKRTQPIHEGFGYGWPDDTSALYHANMLHAGTLVGLLRPYFYRDGTQPIWRHAAKDLDVRTSANVTRVDRTDKVVHYEDASGAHREPYDRLIVAFNPAHALDLLESSPEERAVFGNGNVRTVPYWTYATRVDGLTPPGERSGGEIVENMNREKIGHPVAWMKRHADDNIHVFHLIGDESLSDETIEKNIKDDVEKLGGRFGGVAARRRWSTFFPHFTMEAVKAGAYQKAAQLQGARGTYYVGELFTTSGMARVEENARRTAQRMIKAAAQRMIETP